MKEEDIQFIEKWWSEDYGQEPETAGDVIHVVENYMPAMDEVAPIVRKKLNEIFEKGVDFWDQDYYTFMSEALQAVYEVYPIVKDFKNILGWISGHKGYVDPNDFHPGYYKGVDQFIEDNDLDADDGTYEQFIDTATYINGYWTGENKHNVTPLR